MSIEAFAKALAAFQADLPHVGKDQTAQAGSYSYSYADLTSIQAAAMPLLAQNGLCFTAAPTVADGSFVLSYALLHVDGHSVSGDYPLPDPVQSTAQQIGSAITYGRRYAFCAVTGLSPGGEDDDGKAAADARAAAPVGQPKPDPLRAAKFRVKAAADALGWDKTMVEEEYAMASDGEAFRDADELQLVGFAADLEHRKQKVTA